MAWVAASWGALGPACVVAQTPGMAAACVQAKAAAETPGLVPSLAEMALAALAWADQR